MPHNNFKAKNTAETKNSQTGAPEPKSKPKSRPKPELKSSQLSDIDVYMHTLSFRASMFQDYKALLRLLGEGQFDHPPLPSGPIPKNKPGFFYRRCQTDPLAALHMIALHAEILVLPSFIAYSLEDKDIIRDQVAQIIGLNFAIEIGLVSDFTLIWSHGGYPKVPRQFRLFVPGGKRVLEAALGGRAAEARQFLASFTTIPYDTNAFGG